MSPTELANMQQGLTDRLNADLGELGGFLRCETCGRYEPLGNPGARVMGEGWPKCCGYTMRWWTQRQIDAGEVPPATTRREATK